MSTETNLKAANAASLWAFFIFNFVVFNSLFFTSYYDSILNDFKLMLSARTSGILIAPVVLFIVNGFLSSEQKAILVFWRLKNILPGSRAFSKHGKRDPRVDINRLGVLHAPLPIDPTDQNRLWFKVYKSHSEDIAVLKSHKDFLLARDMTSMAFLYLILAGIPMLFFAKAPLVYYYIIFLLMQYLILVRVGQNKGKAFVTNVLAIESTK